MLQYSVTFSGITGILFRGVLVVSLDDARARVGTCIDGIDTRLTCDDSRVSHLQNIQLYFKQYSAVYVGMV